MPDEVIAEVTTVAKDSPRLEGNRSDESVTEDTPTFDEPEADKPEPTVEAKVDEAEPAKGEAGKVVAAKVVYTPEELETILQSGGDVDTSRLSSEGKVLMKSFQRGFDKKFQQVADMRKAAEAQKPQSPRDVLFDRYVHDPAGVVAEINAEIEKLEGIDPTDMKFQESRVTIARLQALKDDFSVKRQGAIEHGKRVDDIVASTNREILKAIPDFEEKASKLTDFVVDAGLSLAEVRALTDPTVVGPMALKLTKVINALYDKINAPISAEKKVKKDAPAPLQRGSAGTTLDKKTEEDDPGKMAMPQYLAWRKKHAE